MTRFIAFLFLLLTPGCSLLLDDAGECEIGEIYEPAYIRLVSCDAPDRGPHWERWVSRLLYVFDDELASIDMPSMSVAADGYTIEIQKRDPDGPLAGQYQEGLGRIMLWPINANQHWHQTAISHEFWHLYESEILGLTSAEWAFLQTGENPRHFLLGDWAEQFHRYNKLRTKQTGWDCRDDDLQTPPENFGPCQTNTP